MLAMLGLTMAGAGMMKSESARKKQDELVKADTLANVALATALAEQKDFAEENFAENQTIQANAQQSVMTEVTQSEANRQFWADYAIWEQKVAEAEAKRQAQQQTTTTGRMFPPGSTVEDLPPHLQKLFWELGNMHFEKNEGGDWRFADDRGELGYFQYLIREALREGDSEKLTQHFQDANKYIDKTLLNWSDSELEAVRDSAVSLVTQKQNNIPNGNASNKRVELMVETNKGVVDVNHAIQQKSLEIKQDFVERERQHLNTFVDTQVTEHQNIAHQTITTNMSQVAVHIQPPITTGVSGGGNGVMPLHINTGVLSNIINTIPLTLSAEDLPVPPPPDTGSLIVMADTSPEEIDAILATQYTHYLDTNYDVELTTNGEVDWSATETYDAFLATETTAQALYYQAIESGLLELGMSRFDLSTLSPEQVFKNAIGHVEIQKTGSGDLTNTWRPDTDDSLITFSSIPEGDSFQWLLTGEIGRILDNRSFNYGTSELQRNGISHQNEIVSGFNNGNWNRSDAGMIDMSYVGGPSVRGSQTDNPTSDEWADMFAHWVNFTNFRMTQPYDLSEEELQQRFITGYLELPSLPLVSSYDLLKDPYRAYLNLLNVLYPDDTTIPDPSTYRHLEPNSPELEALATDAPIMDEHQQFLVSLGTPISQITSNLNNNYFNRYAYQYPELRYPANNMPTYFDRMAHIDNWVSGSLFTANLWREPSFQENLMDEIRAVDNHWGMYNSPIYNNTFTGEVHDINTIHELSYIHPDLANNVQTYQTHIDNLEILSPTGLKDLYQAQRDLLLRMLHSSMSSRTVGSHDDTPQTQAILNNGQVDVSTEALGTQTPYALHLLTNAQLVSLAQTSTLAAVDSNGAFLNPTLVQLENLFNDAFTRQVDANNRDVIGMPIAGSPVAQATVERPWLLDAMLFGAGMVSEVADYAIATVEGFNYAMQGDWDAVLLTLAFGALPIIPATATRIAHALEPTIIKASRGLVGQEFLENARRLFGRLDNNADNIGNGWSNFGDLAPATPNGANPNHIQDFILRMSNNSGSNSSGGPSLIDLARANRPPHVSQTEWDAVVNNYANDTAMLERLKQDANLGLVPSDRFTSTYIITHLNNLNSGQLLESNARQQALQEGLTFVSVPGTADVTSTETGLRALLGLTRADTTVDMLLQDPTTGNLILAEVKSSSIFDAEEQLKKTLTSMQNAQIPTQNLEFRIYTNSNNYTLLERPQGRYGRRVRPDGTLIDRNTNQPILIDNKPVIVIETKP